MQFHGQLRAELLKAFEASKQDAEKTVKEIARACQEARAAEDNAENTYVLAAGQLTSQLTDLEKVTPPPKPPDLAAARTEEAWVHLRQADLAVRRLRFQAHISRFVDGLTRAWSIPGPSSRPAGSQPAAGLPVALEDVRKYLQDPQGARKSAIKSYAEAVKLYTDAITEASEQLHDAFQDQLAAAYVGWYRVSNDPAVAAKAQLALADALGKEISAVTSPSLAALKRLLKQLKPGGGT